jgi:SAM-dependent methyltransferase
MTASEHGTEQDDWDAHWGDYSESAESNPAQRYRRERIFNLLAAEGSPTHLLDIGSGQGDLLLAVSQTWPNASLAGVELSAQGVVVAKTKVPNANLVQHDLLVSAPHGSLTGWATHAVCSEVLEHVDRPVELLRNCVPMLAPGCRLVVTVPGGPRSAFDKHIGHRRHYRPDDLRSLLVDAGFEVESVYAAGFPAFNLYKLLVIARGKRLIDDVKRPSAGGSKAATAVMKLFNPLFRVARPHSRWGWQLVAVASPK